MNATLPHPLREDLACSLECGHEREEKTTNEQHRTYVPVLENFPKEATGRDGGFQSDRPLVEGSGALLNLLLCHLHEQALPQAHSPTDSKPEMARHASARMRGGRDSNSCRPQQVPNRHPRNTAGVHGRRAISGSECDAAPKLGEYASRRACVCIGDSTGPREKIPLGALSDPVCKR